MKIIVKEGANGALSLGSVQFINGDHENGFGITNCVVSASTSMNGAGPMAITLTIVADEIQFVSE
jgi:hypothetical protein